MSLDKYVKRVVTYSERYVRERSDIAVFLDGDSSESGWQDRAFEFARHYYGPWLDDVVLIDATGEHDEHSKDWNEWCYQQALACDVYSVWYGKGAVPLKRYRVLTHACKTVRQRKVISIETGYEERESVLESLESDGLYGNGISLDWVDVNDTRGHDDYDIETVDERTHGEGIAKAAVAIDNERNKW